MRFFFIFFFISYSQILHSQTLNDLNFKIKSKIIDVSSISIKSITNSKENNWKKQTFAATAKSNNGYYIFFGGGLYTNTTSEKYFKRKGDSFAYEFASITNDVRINDKKKLDKNSEIYKCKTNFYIDWYEILENKNSNILSDANSEYKLCLILYLTDIGMDISIYEKFNKFIKEGNQSKITNKDIEVIEEYDQKLQKEYNFFTMYDIKEMNKLGNINYQLFNMEHPYFYWKCLSTTKYENDVTDTFFCINPASGYDVEENIIDISNIIH